jgi:Glycosyl transferase family 90
MSGRGNIGLVDLDHFAKKFTCEVSMLPRNVVVVGWSAEDDSWLCGPNSHSRTSHFARVSITTKFLSENLLPIMSHRSFWFVLCFWDGWRERHLFSDHYAWVPVQDRDMAIEWRGRSGELPILSSNRRWVACFCAHRGDPSALIFPDPHYLSTFGYAATVKVLRRHQVPWQAKADRAIYAGGNHGEITNYFPPLIPGRPHPRQYLQQIAQGAGIDVFLDRGISIREQLNCKWILDVDGFVRSWDAFAWKMRSGSVTLSAASPWESFFTRLFKPWVHYVPIANDFADLTEKLEWCRMHDPECKQIAHRAQQHAERVYRPQYVSCAVAEQWRMQLDSEDLILLTA